MATPVWTTTAGKIATIDEQIAFSLQLEANTSDSTAIIYSVIAGSLPAGMQVTTDGLLTGTPAEVAKRTLYTFVVRATAGTAITDRTFSLDVQGADTPTFTTAAGQLLLDDSTSVGLYWVIDGSSVELQIQATDTDTEAGQTLVYEITSGSLPPGVTISKSGLISGIVQLTDDQRFGVRGGYDGTGDEDEFDGTYDRTVTTKSISKNFDFIVRVSDGTSFIEQNNSIFVYSADFWRVSNTAITIDKTEIDGSPLTMDLSANRRPVFRTGSDLGTFRHDNAMVVKIDVEDFDPLQGDLEYSIQSGSLPPGIAIDINSGELFGQLARQSAVEVTYNFTVRANRTIVTGLNVFTDQAFTMKVIGEIDIGIAFTTPSVIGTLTAGIPSILSIEAVAESDNRVLIYEKTSGSLPPGITLSPTGNLVGTIDPSEFTDSTRAYTFTATVSDQYQILATSKEFTINIDIPYTQVEYGNMSGHATSFIDQNIFYNVAQDPNINSVDNIFRPEDTNFGMKVKPDILMMAGLEAQTLTAFQQQMEKNHAPKTLYFGDLKTAVAKEDGVVKYEVVYLDIVDDLVGSDGVAIGADVAIGTTVRKPLLGPTVSTVDITADMEVFEFTHQSGLAFSASGSKVRFANQLSADLDFVTTLFPNAVANMRSRIKSLGHKEWDYLPLWMKTTQAGDLAPLGYVKAVPVCYCKPGKSGLVKKRIEDKVLNYKNISFTIDRYVVSNSKVATDTFTADGTTKSFVVDELLHEEDILVKEGSNIVLIGQGVTADNNIKPTYLTADGTLRSADHELGITLSHDTSTQKTTITFTKETPQAGTIIKVERSNDKYLKFRDKGIQ
tara:strand:+ start:6916 stop:9429 length:2514 start_codon:yes stop_codon:yes gene_type:complete